LVFRPRIERLGDLDALCVGWDGARENFEVERLALHALHTLDWGRVGRA
jgi:hypothetical protein